MRMATLVVMALALAVSGCTTTQVNPLSHELDYQFTPAPDVEKSVNRSIAIVPFEDGRMLDGANKMESTSVLVNLLPLVPYTTGKISHPEVSYSTTVIGVGSEVKAAGTMADALPKILAGQLGLSRLFSKATFVTSEEVKGFDYVLRGKLVNSTVTSTRLSYCVGPAAVALYVIGAPFVHYSAELTVEWQLYDAGGQAVGARQTATLAAPIEQCVALYWGMWADNKTVPTGLYVEAIKTVNQQIADGVVELVRAK